MITTSACGRDATTGNLSTADVSTADGTDRGFDAENLTIDGSQGGRDAADLDGARRDAGAEVDSVQLDTSDSVVEVAVLPWAKTLICASGSRQVCGLTSALSGRSNRAARGGFVGPYSLSDTLLQWQNKVYSSPYYQRWVPPLGRDWMKLHPSLGRVHGDVWNHWRPVRLTLRQNGLIRLEAIWAADLFNDGSKHPLAATCALNLTKGCDRLTPDVAPTGCVTVDIDPVTATAVAAAFDVESFADWTAQAQLTPVGSIARNTIDAQWQTPLLCAAQMGIKDIPKEKIAIDLPDGSRLVAHPGRSQWEAVMTPGANPATLLRDVFGKNGAWSTAPVVEIYRPADLSSGGTPTAVPLDVHICRVSEAEVAESGCACTQAPWPPASTAKPKGDNWAIIEVLGTSTKYVIDEASLTAIQGGFFTAAGHTKNGQMPLPNGGTGPAYCLLPEVKACCIASKKCSTDAFPRWSCGASGKTKNGTMVLRGGLDTRLASNLNVYIECHLAWLSEDAAALKTLPADFPPSSFVSNPKNHCYAWLDDGFSIRDAPPGQRHRAWSTLSTRPAWMWISKAGVVATMEERSQYVDITVVDYGPKFLEVDFVATGVRSRWGVQYDPYEILPPPPTPQEDPNANVQRVQIRVRARFTTP